MAFTLFSRARVPAAAPQAEAPKAVDPIQALEQRWEQVQTIPEPLSRSHAQAKLLFDAATSKDSIGWAKERIHKCFDPVLAASRYLVGVAESGNIHGALEEHGRLFTGPSKLGGNGITESEALVEIGRRAVKGGLVSTPAAILQLISYDSHAKELLALARPRALQVLNQQLTVMSDVNFTALRAQLSAEPAKGNARHRLCRQFSITVEPALVSGEELLSIVDTVALQRPTAKA